ncbi:glycosyltransferase [Candidatus Poribacteria bacterium]|nr:glycosyltransferase [Candidatus Poribacteria bacterium]
MPKMLLVTDKFGPHKGGTAIVYSNWCSLMNPKDIVVLTCRLPSAPEWREFDNQQRFKIYRVPFINIPKIRMPLAWIFMLFVMPFILIKEKPQIIHAGQVLETGWFCILINKIFNKKYVVHTYGEEITYYSVGKGRFLKKALIWSIVKADIVTTVSNYTKSKLINLGIPDEKIRLIYPGVELDKFQIVPDLEELRDKHQLHNKRILLTVSRLMERKGHDMVIKAFPRVLQKIPDVIYLIVGIGKEEKRLKELTRELDLENYVIFTGQVPDVIQYYYLCDVFIMPNRMVKGSHDVEGFGIVFLEANACGKPVIGGKSGGAVDAIVDGVTGILVDPTNIKEIENAILKLFLDDSYRSRISDNGRNYVFKNFDWINPVKQVLEINSSIVD